MTTRSIASFRPLPAAAAMLLAAAGAAHAGPWTSTGSTCLPDDDSLGAALQSLQVVSVSAALLPKTVRVRCNVTDTFDRKGLAGPVGMGMRFVDTGAGANVTARLWQHNFVTGAVAQLMLINSDASPPAAAAQSVWNYAGCGVSMDFNRNAYWIEATLTRGNTQALPALHQLRIVDDVLC